MGIERFKMYLHNSVLVSGGVPTQIQQLDGSQTRHLLSGLPHFHDNQFILVNSHVKDITLEKKPDLEVYS